MYKIKCTKTAFNKIKKDKTLYEWLTDFLAFDQDEAAKKLRDMGLKVIYTEKDGLYSYAIVEKNSTIKDANSIDLDSYLERNRPPSGDFLYMAGIT